MKRLPIIALSLATALTSALPAEAFPIIAAPDVKALQAQPVDYHGGYHGGYYGGYHGGYYHHHGGNGWGWALGGLATGLIIGGALAQPYYGGYYDSGYYDRNYYNSGYYDSGYYEFGHHPRYYAPHYYAPRYYYRRAYYYGGSSHVRWCLARYRSYRAYDDTFQPNHGPRQVCVSPY
ncbi:hypothetical protein FHX15_001907 [Rhizobium sp. BK650]|uniref:BA14K family protein n=1 Tax=Rhizobium sp. BK650 TaxID=2586990 RepID=UPI001615DB59|nr:BA14K family protein [Rhizobium sp. BK650]MBB3656679.1 hypothetical protein [Rhizobium sp. BK650]